MCHSNMWTSDQVLNLSKDEFKHTSCDLEDGLTWVEKNFWVELGLHQVCERSICPFVRHVFGVSENVTESS